MVDTLLQWLPSLGDECGIVDNAGDPETHNNEDYLLEVSNDRNGEHSLLAACSSRPSIIPEGSNEEGELANASGVPLPTWLHQYADHQRWRTMDRDVQPSILEHGERQYGPNQSDGDAMHEHFIVTWSGAVGVTTGRRGHSTSRVWNLRDADVERNMFSRFWISTGLYFRRHFRQRFVLRRLWHQFQQHVVLLRSRNVISAIIGVISERRRGTHRNVEVTTLSPQGYVKS